MDRAILAPSARLAVPVGLAPLFKLPTDECYSAVQETVLNADPLEHCFFMLLGGSFPINGVHSIGWF